MQKRDAMKVSVIEGKISSIMEELELEITDDNRKTPERVAKMLVLELFKNRNNNNIEELKEQMTTFPFEGGKIFEKGTVEDETVEVRDIPFFSMCSHHWLPFFGKASVKYKPNLKIIGLSKIPRVVEYFSRRPQVQERLSRDIGSFLIEVLDPMELIIEIEATHTCVCGRGVEKDCLTKTRYVYKRDSRLSKYGD